MKSLLDNFKIALKNAGIVDTDVYSGMVWLPEGIELRKLFIEIVRELCLKRGIDEYLFPTFVSGKEFHIMADNIFDFTKRVFWLDNNKLLRPSGESLFYPQFRKWIKTYKDLPIKAYQIGTSFRRGTPRGIFRLNEADLFIEGHTAHSSRDEAVKQVEEDIELQKELFDIMGIPAIFTNRPLWGNNPVGERIVGIDVLLPSGETLLVGSAYSQMQMFSKPFGVKFRNANNEKDYTYQTSFGFSSRVIFSSLFLALDDRGINLLPRIAPKQLIIMPIFNKVNEKAIKNYVDEVYILLTSCGYRVRIEQSEKSIGERRLLIERQGVPIRIEIGEKEVKKKNITVISRVSNERLNVCFDDLNKTVSEMLHSAEKLIKKRILERNNEHLIEFDMISDSFAQAIDNGNVVKVPLCIEEGCCKKIEKMARGEVIGYINDEKYIGSCVICGRKTNSKAIQARHV